MVALFAFTLSWNEFLYALVFIGSDSQKTLTVGLIGLVRGDTFPWGPMMAAALLGRAAADTGLHGLPALGGLGPGGWERQGLDSKRSTVDATNST